MGETMAKEHAHEFLKRLDDDADLRAKVRAARDAMSDQIVAIAKEHGHELTAAELREAMHEKWDGRAEFRKTDDDGDDPSTCFVPVSERPRY